MHGDVDLIWQQQSEYVHVCRAPALPRQRSDDEATCVGLVIRDWLDASLWHGRVGTRSLGIGPLSLIKRFVELEARILCSGRGGAVA